MRQLSEWEICMQFARPSLRGDIYTTLKTFACVSCCHRITLCLFPGEITAQKFGWLWTVDKIAVTCGKGGSAKQTGKKIERSLVSLSLLKEAGSGLGLFTCRMKDCIGHLKEKNALLLTFYCDWNLPGVLEFSPRHVQLTLNIQFSWILRSWRRTFHSSGIICSKGERFFLWNVLLSVMSVLLWVA